MLNDRNILITGASSGIGEQVAIDCIKFKSNIFTISRRSPVFEFEEDVFPNARKHILFRGDVTQEEDLDLFVGMLPNLDGLVLNAGVISYRPISLINSNSLNDIFSVNFNSNVMLVQKLLKLKKINKNASIVFIGSISSQLGLKGTALYAASKAALTSFSKVLAAELSDKGIRSNIVSPGVVQSKKVNYSSQNLVTDESYPLGIGKVSDVSDLILFLLSDKSRWITGTDILIDGGYSLSKNK